MNKLEEYKKENNYKTSESVFYMDKQPGDTCPIINEIISVVDNALSQLEDDDDFENIKYWIKHYLSDVEKIAEEARENVENIRKWGQEWKDKCKEVIEKSNIEIDEIV